MKHEKQDKLTQNVVYFPSSTNNNIGKQIPRSGNANINAGNFHPDTVEYVIEKAKMIYEIFFICTSGTKFFQKK